MPEETEEQFMQRRLLLASVLSVMGLMTWVYMNRPPEGEVDPSQPPAVEQTEDPTTEAPAPALTIEAAEPGESATGESAETKAAASEHV